MLHTNTEVSHSTLPKCSVLHCLLFNSTIKAPMALCKGCGERWYKRPYYSSEFCRESASAASGNVLINADLRSHIRPTGSESFTRILHVIHLHSDSYKHSIRQVTLFLSCTLESSGANSLKLCLILTP